MTINIQDDIAYFQKLKLDDRLLSDKTMGANIIHASDGNKQQLCPSLFPLIKPRFQKEAESQSLRTREHAEVFTPSWVCGEMNGYAKAQLGKEKSGDAYLKAKVLEITCGEAPFLVNRYDSTTGEVIPLDKRCGLLDDKLKLASETSIDENQWMEKALIALQSCYGYEWQGDSLLIARINVAMTIAEHMEGRWEKRPDVVHWRKILNIISWNLWQMDGLTGTIPYGEPEDAQGQLDLFSLPDTQATTPLCRIYDWRNDKSMVYSTKGSKHMKFDFIIGNPPYNEDFENSGDNGNFGKPIYNDFMDGAYQVADKVELIHPARFLFNAGSTPKEWNQKMLSDPHFKVLKYEADSKKLFDAVDIKGGVAISFYDKQLQGNPIGTFTAFEQLNGILEKVKTQSTSYLNTLISGRGVYRLSPKAVKEHPELEQIQSKGHITDVGTGAFRLLDSLIFFQERPHAEGYVQCLGLISAKREYRWCRQDYLNVPDSFYKYKVFIPKANGSGALGEVLSTPLIGEPLIGATETFLSIGSFDTEAEAQACMKYVKSKFARVMLGILKTTQDNTSDKWLYVPLQDFTSHSDIDWRGSVHEVDVQLFRKYGLSLEEISFIEEKVKEMA